MHVQGYVTGALAGGTVGALFDREAMENQTKPKMGRPPIEIDWRQFDSLCALQCTLTEIASFFHCSVDTIENKVKQEFGCTFSELYREKREAGRISLRRQQFKLAEKGNATMLIWLGKQWLEQKDKSDVTSAGEKLANGIEITVVHKNQPE